MQGVTIVTVTLNCETTIGDAIDSIGREKANGQPIELIIIDGGSSDGTLDVIREKSSMVDTWLSEPDNGIADAFNKGINLSTREIIGIVSGDDWLPVGVVSRVLREFQRNSETDILYGNAEYLDATTGKLLLSLPTGDLRSMRKGVVLRHASTWIRKTAYEKYGLYDKRLMLAMDYELELRYLCQGAKFQYVDAVLGAFRSGGINAQRRIDTMLESRAIAIKYGLSEWEANALFCYRVVKHVTKSLMPEVLLNRLLPIWRGVTANVQQYAEKGNASFNGNRQKHG